MNRQNFPEAEQFPQSNADALRELLLAVVVVFLSGCAGAVAAYVIWG